MILSRSFHRQSCILNFSLPDLSSVTYWIAVFKLLHRKSEILASRCSTCLKMGFVIAMIYKGSFRLCKIRVIPLSGDSSSTAHLEVSKLFCCTIQINVSVPLAHSAHMEDDIRSEHQNPLECNFKMVAFLVGLQGGFIKFQCCLCLLESRNTALHCKKSSWPPRTSYENRSYNMKQQPLVDAAKILMPPLNIKLGLIKQFVKQVDTEGEAFKQIQELYPKLSEAKIKAGVFVAPEVKRMIAFSEMLSKVEQTAWACFVCGFLGSQWVPGKAQGRELQRTCWWTCGCTSQDRLQHVAESPRTTCSPW